ncbi:MAG: DUF6069 family protein [Pseudonocardia sp.]
MATSLARPSVRSRALAVVGGAVAALAVWVVAVPLLGVDLTVAPGGVPQVVGVVPVIVTPLVAGLLGWGLLAVLERLLRNGRRVWLVVAVVLTLLSVIGPLTSAVTAGGAVTLALMHLVVAAVVVPGLVRATT